MNRSGQSLLVLVALASFSVGRIKSNLFVVLLQRGHVLPRIAELSLLHALADIPVDEGPLGVHQVELVVQSRPRLSDGGGVGEHTDGTLHLGEISTRDDSRGLVVDSNLESSGTPVHKLDAPLALDGCDGGVVESIQTARCTL